MTKPTDTYWQYEVRLWRRTFEHFKWVVDLVIATVMAALTAWVQIRWGLIPADQKQLFLFSIIAPYVLVFLLHVLWRRIIAPWQLDLAKQNEIATYKVDLDKKNHQIAELEWPADRPVIQFVKWDENPQPNNFHQCGFFLLNTGGACLEARIEEFRVGSQHWGGEKVSGIAPNETKFLLVWNGQGNAFNRFDLLRSMRDASPRIDAIYRPDFSVSVSALFRDSKNLWYRAKTELTYIHSQSRVRFEPTTIEKVSLSRVS